MCCIYLLSYRKCFSFYINYHFTISYTYSRFLHLYHILTCIFTMYIYFLFILFILSPLHSLVYLLLHCHLYFTDCRSLLVFLSKQQYNNIIFLIPHPLYPPSIDQNKFNINSTITFFLSFHIFPPYSPIWTFWNFLPLQKFKIPSLSLYDQSKVSECDVKRPSGTNYSQTH